MATADIDTATARARRQIATWCRSIAPGSSLEVVTGKLDVREAAAQLFPMKPTIRTRWRKATC